MTIRNALVFIERGLKDSALRSRLNSVQSSSELQCVLEDEEIAFSPKDFDEAYHHRLTQCQEEDEADQIKEFKMWWDLLGQSLGMTACDSQCSKCRS